MAASDNSCPGLEKLWASQVEEDSCVSETGRDTDALNGGHSLMVTGHWSWVTGYWCAAGSGSGNGSGSGSGHSSFVTRHSTFILSRRTTASNTSSGETSTKLEAWLVTTSSFCLKRAISPRGLGSHQGHGRVFPRLPPNGEVPYPFPLKDALGGKAPPIPACLSEGWVREGAG